MIVWLRDGISSSNDHATAAELLPLSAALDCYVFYRDCVYIFGDLCIECGKYP